MKKTITITIDSDDQQASASSLKSGIMQGVSMYEETFRGDSLTMQYSGPTQGLNMNFAPLPRTDVFRYKVTKNQTVPLAQRGRPKAEE